MCNALCVEKEAVRSNFLQVGIYTILSFIVFCKFNIISNIFKQTEDINFHIIVF